MAIAHLIVEILRSIFAGAARRAGPDSMLILCEFVSEFEMISRPQIGRKLTMSPDVVQCS